MPFVVIGRRTYHLRAEVDHVVCLNVLSNIDNYHRPLERLLLRARKSLVLRESIGETSEYLYVEDRFLDPGVRLKVHVNRYSAAEMQRFIQGYGFDVEFIVDRRTGGKPEEVIGYQHHWCFVRVRRKS